MSGVQVDNCVSQQATKVAEKSREGKITQEIVNKWVVYLEQDKKNLASYTSD